MSINAIICPICGGARLFWYKVEALDAKEVEEYTLPASAGFKLCSGCCELMPKHDGKLDEEDGAKVQYGAMYPGERGLYISDGDNDDCVYLNARQALSLLAWLKQEQETLEQLTEE